MIGKGKASWSFAAVLALGIGACGEPRGRASPPVSAEAARQEAQAPVVASPPAPGAVAGHPSPAAAAPQGAIDAGQLRARLTAAFSGFEHVPDKAELLALAPADQLTPALWGLWQDASTRQIIRANALLSLRFFPSSQVQAWFEQLLADPATPPTVRRPLAKAYGFAFGVGALAMLGQQLDHAEPHTRDSAARALGAIADPRARALLEKRLAVEAEPFVRQTLQKLLGKPAGAP